MIYNVSGDIINTPGTVNKDIKTNLVVNTQDVVLQDMIIEGNLYLTEGIGEGDVTLNNVTIKGNVVVKGGGANSVIIKNSKLNKISVDKQQGLVRVVFDNTSVEEVKTTREVKLELTKGTEIKVVQLAGKVEVAVEKGASIVTLEVTSKDISIKAEGTIKSITATQEIEINGTKIKANTETKVEEGKASDVKKDTQTTQPTQTPSEESSRGDSDGSSSGGSSSGGESVIPTPTPIYPTAEINRILSLLKDGMLDDIPYPGDEKDESGTKYSLASFVGEEVGKLTTNKNIRITASNFNNKFDKDGEIIEGTNTIKRGYYEVTLTIAGKSVSKEIKIDTITVSTEKSFRDALGYNINTIKLKNNIDIPGDINIDKLTNIVFGGYTLNINGRPVTAANVDQPAPIGLGTSKVTAAGNDGKIMGVTTEMEYKLDSDKEYKKVTSSEITGLSEGMYYIRFAAKPGFNPGKIALVIIEGYVDPSILVNNITVTGAKEGDKDATTIDIAEGTMQMSAEVKPSNAGDKKVTWSVTPDGIATIDQHGFLRAVTNGTVIVKATANDGSGIVSSKEITISNQVVIGDKDITSIKTIVDINVNFGTENANLPAKVILVLDDSSEVEADVVWDGGSPLYDGNTSGSYTFSGVITLPNNVTNTKDIKATVTVVVAEK